MAAVVWLSGCTVVRTGGSGTVPVRVEPGEVAPADRGVAAGDRTAGAGSWGEDGSAEMRGVWVVRTALTTPEQVLRVVEESHAAGINTLFVQVRGRANAYYRSELEPYPEWTELDFSDFDPLELLIREAHDRGMRVHAWVVAQLVWGLAPLPRDPAHLVNTNPEWLAVPRELALELHGMSPSDPRYVQRLHAWAVENEATTEGLFASPSHPGARARLAAVVEDLVRRYEVDGIHLDYIRYPSPEYDYSRSTLDDFRAWARRQLPPGLRSGLEARDRAGDVLAWTRENPRLWNDWRESQVTETLLAVRAAMEPWRDRVVLSAAVFADPVDALQGRFQDWPEWLRGGWIDAAATMAYTPDLQRFEDLLESARRADSRGGGERIWAGVGVYRTDVPGAARQLAAAREAGVSGFLLFSYNWAAEDEGEPGGGSYLDDLARTAFPAALPR
jgi:uncharacterized lipoprotein YddW (UPF0748 family)